MYCSLLRVIAKHDNLRQLDLLQVTTRSCRVVTICHWYVITKPHAYYNLRLDWRYN